MTHLEYDALTERCLSWVDGLCAAYLSVEQNQCPEAFQGRGIVIPESQVITALSGQCPMEPVPGFEGQLEALLEEAEAAAGTPLAQLMKRLQLEGAEVLAFLLALAPRLNRKYERIFGYLQDDVSARNATVGLCADLWSLVRDEDVSASLEDPDRPLNRYGLVETEHGLGRELVPRESAVLAVRQAAYLPGTLRDLCQVLDEEELPEILDGEGQIRQAQHFATCCLAVSDKPGLLQIFGPAGSGKRFLVRHVGAMIHRPVILMDCEQWSLLEEQKRAEVLGELTSWAYLHHAVPALTRFFAFPGRLEEDRNRLARQLLAPFRQDAPLTILCGEKPEQLRAESSFRSLHLNLPEASIRFQQKCWTAFSQQKQLALGPELQPQQLATTYTLSPGQIQQVLSLAEADALSRQRTELDWPAITQGVRLLCSHRLRGLTEPMELNFTWEDLEVDPLAREQLQELCDRIRCRWKVNEEWGFHKRLPYGKGISVCLYGPPGTGKTMTAQVLAREFGLDAYRVDMSRIIDKYIGETEKKLSELFDAARDSNSVLFFDEADALFAKRTEVADSKDRYANVETAYLLQRMEQHNGISILATNAVNNFDAAFKRRISYMISLPMPDVETRKRLWHKVFPAQAPLNNVDLDWLATQFELTGSSIKNVALHAAYLAAAQEKSIGQDELIRAIQKEYRKTGRILMEGDCY